MSEEDVLNRVREIFRDVFNKDDLIIENYTNSGDIEEWDSLNHINIISFIEKEFSIKFLLGELEILKNVGDLRDSIMKKLV
ncbi:acyl carrier protein [Sulfurimonas sp.]